MKKSVIFLEMLKRKSKITSVMIIEQHIKKEHTELIPGSNVCKDCGKNFRTEDGKTP